MADHVRAIDAVDNRPVGQHRHHRIGALHGFLHIGEGCAAITLRPFQCLGGKVEGADVMARLDEVCSHPAAHVAEADKGDLHDNISPVAIQC